MSETDPFKRLREPFPDSAIGHLPRAGIKLDYVGHAAVTDRLLEVDPKWTWEPVAFADDGAPLIGARGTDAVLWIRLTVCGVTRYGVGIAPAKAFELEKQLISDALRNAAMRFGVALDLWSKEDLSGAEDGDGSGLESNARGQTVPELPDAHGFTTIAHVRQMKPPELMAFLKRNNIQPEGTVERMRERALELVS